MIIKKFQEGGAAPAAPAQAPQGGEEQMMQQLAQMAQEIIQQLGPEASAMLAQIIMEMLQGAPQEVGAAPEEQQFMRCGGKIKKKTCKKACGGSVKKTACGGSVKKSACGGSVKKTACGGSVKRDACGGSVKKDACGGKTSKCKTKKSCK